MPHTRFFLPLAASVICLAEISSGQALAQSSSQLQNTNGMSGSGQSNPIPPLSPALTPALTQPLTSPTTPSLASPTTPSLAPSTTPPLRPYSPPPADLAGSSPTTPGLVPTTTQHIDGYHVRRYLGVVRGVKVFQPTMGESLRASLKGIVGGNIGSYAEMCDKARQQAYDQLIERSTALGANAILGLHFDSSSFGSGSAETGTEIICYGTAVILEPDR